MKRSIRFCLCVGTALLFCPSAFAFDDLQPQMTELQVSRFGDVNMDCGALSQEAMLMHDIISTTQDIRDRSAMQGHGISAAGAIGSFLVGTATGGVGIAAAGFLLNQTTKEHAKDAETVQDVAAQRRTLMMGIYNAKGCYGPMEFAMQDRPPESLMEMAGIEPAAGTTDSGRSGGNRTSHLGLIPALDMAPPKKDYNR